MLPANTFEITKRSPRPYRTFVTPDADALRGIAFQESATAGTAELADGTKPYDGFVTRKVLQGGPTLGDSVYPNRTELPFTAAQEATMEFAEEFVAEGSDYIYSGTGGITSDTALKSLCGFKDGKIRVAQSSEYADFMLVEKSMTPVNTGALRCRFKAINSMKVA